MQRIAWMMMMSMTIIIVDEDDDDDGFDEGGDKMVVELTAERTGWNLLQHHCIPLLTELQPGGGPRAKGCASFLENF